jgi:hypothetical protein
MIFVTLMLPVEVRILPAQGRIRPGMLDICRPDAAADRVGDDVLFTSSS